MCECGGGGGGGGGGSRRGRTEEEKREAEDGGEKRGDCRISIPPPPTHTHLQFWCMEVMLELHKRQDRYLCQRDSAHFVPLPSPNTMKAMNCSLFCWRLTRVTTAPSCELSSRQIPWQIHQNQILTMSESSVKWQPKMGHILQLLSDMNFKLNNNLPLCKQLLDSSATDSNRALSKENHFMISFGGLSPELWYRASIANVGLYRLDFNAAAMEVGWKRNGPQGVGAI